MKRILYLAVSLLFVTSFMSCEKDLETKGISRLTYYADIQLAGSTKITINAGDSYTDPGVTVTENGVAIPYTSSVTSKYFGYVGTAVNPNIADIYYVNYTAINKDGFSSTKSRLVTVNLRNGDFVNSIEGLYRSTVTRTPNQGTVPANKELEYIWVSNLGGNTYGISDALGAYYAVGRGIGDATMGLGATFTADIPGATTTVTNSNFDVSYWGDSGVLNSVTIDAANKKLVVASTYAGMVFTSTLTQVQP